MDKYLEYSEYTDGGEYAYLYNDLPHSLKELCTLVKTQLVHPFDVDKYAGAIPKDRANEDREFPTVSLMLDELIKRDENGLTLSRQPQNRLVVACVHHSMLLTSILRSRGVPVRMLAGYATYIGGNHIRVTHALCEVWDFERKKWILVDPDRQRIDVPRREFEFASKTWFRLKRRPLSKKQYISRYKTRPRRPHIYSALISLLSLAQKSLILLIRRL